MKKIMGYLKNLQGTFFAKDVEGNLREVNHRDAIYSGEIVVDEEGNTIPHAIHSEIENKIDSNNEEANVEAESSGQKDTKTSSESETPKSTTSTDIIHSHGDIHNIDASLLSSEFHRENTGLIQTHEHEDETNINAPLRKNEFDNDDERHNAEFFHIYGGDKPPFLTINDRIVNEDAGTMTFTVTLSKITASDVIFDYYSADLIPADALEGLDYTGVSGRGVIAAGTFSTTITVPITDDFFKEGNEDFLINLVPVSNNIDIEN